MVECVEHSIFIPFTGIRPFAKIPRHRDDIVAFALQEGSADPADPCLLVPRVGLWGFFLLIIFSILVL
jgi:hypothetical protein